MKEKRKNILTKNGFVFKNNVWTRDDGYILQTVEGKYLVVAGTGDVFYGKSMEEQMGFLVLSGLVIVYC